MNNFKKIGMTALAASLVSTSVFAGELTVSGAASISYENYSTTDTVAAASNNKTFTQANNMHASVAALMGRRAVRESFTALTTKLSKKSGYYKGKRSVSPGWHEKKVGGGGKGRFVLLDWKKPTYVIPEGLNAFTLKAYVAKGVTK